MKLRRITLSGFKTFARRSEVVLEPGITAVVGPNGSGKSNLVDAIRWALGETNARELRGARMDEVIYAGGDGRGRMGMAEVELVFDNEDGRLQVDDPEVAVRRRVTRQGDSDFRLNGRRLRLRDLERVLSATGLTQDGYAVVAQNDIDGIIQATPAQRRSLVETAAGVRSLHAACDDALHRVVGVEDRLTRLHDLLAEAEPRLAELAEQAEVALEQRAIADRLAELRGSLAREQWRSARAQARVARNRLAAALRSAEAAAEAERGFSDRLESERGALEAARAARDEAAAALETARLAAERASGGLRRWGDRLESALLGRGAAAVEVGAAGLEAAAAREQLDALGAAATAAAAAHLDRDATLVGLRDEHASAAALAREAVARLDECRAATDRVVREHTAAEATLRESEGRVALLDESLAALAGEEEASRRRSVELSAEAARAAEHAEAAARDAATARSAAAAARELASGQRQAADAARRALADTEQHARRLATRAAGLRGEVEGRLGAGGPVARAIAAGSLAGSRLIDHFSVRDEADRPALEAALEEHLAAWLVADLDTVAALLGGDGARETVVHAVSAMPAAAAPAPAGTRPAAGAVHADAATEGLVTALLADTWLAGDLATARTAIASAGGRAVLPDGTVVTASGLRGGGRPGATLALAAEAGEADAAASVAAAAAADARSGSRAADEGLVEAEAAADRLQGTAEAARRAAAEADARSAAAGTSARAEERRAAALEATRASRAADRERALAQVTASTDAAHEAAGRVQAARERLDAVEEAHAGAVARREATVERLRAAEAEVERLRLAAEDAARRLQGQSDAAEAAGRRTRVAELRLLAAETDIVIALSRTLATRAESRRVAGAVEAAEARAVAAGPPVLAAEAAVAAIETERAAVAVAAARAEDERRASAAELAAAEGRVAELAEAARGEEDDETVELDPAAAEKADREIVRLERRITALGPVNALAPGQHDRLAERVHLWRSQRGDLGDACVDLRAVVTHLQGEITRRFDAVFGAVNYHFRELYAELFPGGKATLRLQEVVAPVAEEGEEPKAAPPAGIEIIATPPGKRAQHLTLLSGGERALTALAVILALQQVNPSPFYLFDEVDAALDDANVLRFTRVLQRLAERQQFLVITHNHATMAAADALYGVSIDREGVSSVLSVRFTGGANEPLAVRPMAKAV